MVAVMAVRVGWVHSLLLLPIKLAIMSFVPFHLSNCPLVVMHCAVESGRALKRQETPLLSLDKMH